MNPDISALDVLPQSLSLVKGNSDYVLNTEPLGVLIDQNAATFGRKPALVSSWQHYRASFSDLAASSASVSKALIDLGVQKGDHIGIVAGNRYEYIHIFLGGGRIGRPVVVLNNMFSPQEMCAAVLRSDCRAVFIASTIGKRDMKAHIEALARTLLQRNGRLKNVVVIGDNAPDEDGFETYKEFLGRAQSIFVSEATFRRAQKAVKATDVLNLQFTSGTTGAPKAAMLTHLNLINNGYLNGEAMRLSPDDIVCCPPPLFHCFGLTMGFLNAFSHGSSIVFPNDDFNAGMVVSSLVDEQCTALLGVPTMFLAELQILKQRSIRLKSVRTGLAAGSAVSKSLMDRIKREMNIDGMIIAYGMTETSPVTFMTSLDDPDHLRLTSLGRVLPHTAAKIIAQDGSIVPRGVRGELCTSGYALQRGYYKNDLKTQEVMTRDAAGVLWMHTGDECFIDNDGYCFITGRLKDIIIRGGENIYPREIEERLLEHTGIADVSVAAIKDDHYGEVVGAFIRAQGDRPSDSQVKEWVRSVMGRHKVPEHVFWIGDTDVGDNFPMTASGKHQKHILSNLGQRLLKERKAKAKL